MSGIEHEGEGRNNYTFPKFMITCSLQWSVTVRSDWVIKVWPSIVDITSFQAETLISPYYNNGGFLPMTPLRQDSYLFDPTQITTNRSPLFPFPSFQMASFLCLNSSATLQDLSEGASLSKPQLPIVLGCTWCVQCAWEEAAVKTVLLLLLECCADHSSWSLTIQIVTKHDCKP